MSLVGEVIVGLCCLIAIIVCSIRFYLRVIVAKQRLWIEFLLVVAACFLLATLGAQIKMFELLKLMDNVQAIILANKLAVTLVYFYLVTLWAVKLSVNLLHVRITESFPKTHTWAVRSVYILVILFFVSIASYIAGCYPPSRRWYGPVGYDKPCPAMLKEWDWWTITITHILSDIWLCALPFPALVTIGERRLRLAVYGVYSLASAAIIVSVVRIVLLGTDPESNLEIIMILSTAEMSATVVVGALPCISSAFVRKYVGNSCEKTFFSWKGSIAQRYQKRTSFVQVHGDGSSQRAKGNWLKLSRTTSQRMSGHFECASTAGVTEDDIRERDIETTITTTLSVS